MARPKKRVVVEEQTIEDVVDVVDNSTETLEDLRPLEIAVPLPEEPELQIDEDTRRQLMHDLVEVAEVPIKAATYTETSPAQVSKSRKGGNNVLFSMSYTAKDAVQQTKTPDASHIFRPYDHFKSVDGVTHPLLLNR